MRVPLRQRVPTDTLAIRRDHVGTVKNCLSAMRSHFPDGVTRGDDARSEAALAGGLSARVWRRLQRDPPLVAMSFDL